MPIPELGWLGIVISAFVLLIAQPLYIVIMSKVLRWCGVPRKSRVEWALRHADQMRFRRVVCELISAFRGRGGDPPAQ
ncbi:hypothetical protein GCM10009609_07680 [Pseudonocardia aurantiaca]